MGKHFGRAMNPGSVIFGSTHRSLEGFIHIKRVLTLGHSVGKQRGGMIADHSARVVPGKFPHRKHTTLPGFQQERTHIIIVEVGIDNRHQRMQRTESVPYRKYGVNRLVDIALLCFAVHAQITAVGISE